MLQALAVSINGPAKTMQQMPWEEAVSCPVVTPKSQIPATEHKTSKREWIAIVSVGGTAMVLAIVGQTISIMLAWFQWCCFLRCGTRKAFYEP